MREAIVRTTVAVTLAVGLGLVTGQYRTSAEMRKVLQRAEPHLVRQLTMDRLSGKELSQNELSWIDSVFDLAHAHREQTSLRILWIVDVPNCPGCLADVLAWNELSANPGVSTLLVVAGTTTGEASGIGESAGVTGPVIADASGLAISTFRLTTPSTRLVIRDGKILLADGRGPLQGCNWTAEELVTAMIGLT